MKKEIKETNDLAYLVATAIVSDKTAQETAEYLYKKGYRKQEPKNIIPVGKGCDVHCGTLEQYDNFLREITKDTIKEFAEKHTDILKEIIQNRLDYHCDKTKYRYELGKACVEFFISDIIKDLINELKKEYGVE
jgi:hypothetical protein